MSMKTPGSANGANETPGLTSSEEPRDASRLGASTQLTDEERYKNEAWRMRLRVGSVFARDYIPKGYEKKEMGEIIDFLSLKDPDEYLEYLVSWCFAEFYVCYVHEMCNRYSHTPVTGYCTSV